MRNRFKRNYIALLILISPSILVGQIKLDSVKNLVTSTTINIFIDNTEFSRAAYSIDQTMAGISLGQTLGWKFDNRHKIEGGANLLKGFGSENTIDKINFLAFYQFQNKKTLFKAGSFLWDNLLDDYNSFFFQDSIRFYKKTIDGLFFKRKIKDGYFKLWLDWTGMQSPTRREQFLVGFSGLYSFNKNFYVDVQSYVMHLANLRPKNWSYNVHDNILVQSTIGYNNQIGIWDFNAAGGILAGFERNRWYLGNYYFPVGAVGKFNVSYKKFGTNNLIYFGQPRLRFYNRQGNRLYYGNTFLQGNYYWENMIFWIPFQTDKVNSKLAMKTHLSEGKIFFEQLFTLKVNL